jgi:glycosyltransferase involved in cell wall biosynthesis
MGGSWDILHTHGMRANLPVRAIVRLMWRRPPLFTTVHSDLVLDYVNPLKVRTYMLVDRLSAGVVDGFFCVSHELAARLAAQGISKSRIEVIHPGIEPSSTSAASEEPVLGTIARLVAVKDIELLLETARLVRQEIPALKVVVVGDGPERRALERAAEGLGLGAVVSFKGEIRPARPVLSEFQVFVLTSVSEGVPVAALEAMCAGLPVVATAVGGVPEVVEEGVSGFLVERREDRARTAFALAERVSSLLADPALRARMGAAGRKRVLEDFSTSTAATKTLRCYRRSLAAHSDGGRWA